MLKSGYIKKYLDEVSDIARRIDQAAVKQVVDIIRSVKKGPGRLFILGVGGSAGNAGHAVNDFRKLCGIEAYSPTDNVSELTARINDNGWDTSFADWLKVSALGQRDAVMIFSVGGGNAQKKISNNLVVALEYAKQAGAKIVGIVGRDGGYTAQVADAVVIVPTVNPQSVTPHSEAFQAVIWHLIVTHPDLKAQDMKWESVK